MTRGKRDTLGLLVVACTLACSVGGTRPHSDAPVPAARTSVPGEPDSCPPTRGQRVMEQVNLRRAQAGLEPLEADERLVAAAREHAQDVARLPGVPGHVGSDGSDPAERATRAGYVWARVGENVAAGVTEPSMVVALWMNSRGHRHNILTREFRDAGVATAESAGPPRRAIWVMEYGRAATDRRKTLPCHP